jgi:thiol:disulfide interchange protein
MRTKTCRTVLVLLALRVLTLTAAGAEPFNVTAALVGSAEQPRVLVSFAVAPAHFLYADMMRVEAREPAELAPAEVPEPIEAYDKFSESMKLVYKEDFTALYDVVSAPEGVLTIEVGYQGCSEELCFFPETREWTFTLDAAVGAGKGASDAQAPSAVVEQDAVDWEEAVKDFRVLATGSGYMEADEFLAFLEEAKAGASDRGEGKGLAGQSLGIALMLILLGGLALNLTPCVLPMIPINIAIIGAGAQAGSRGRGFALGGVYGAAIALTYGILGLAVVLTGSTFGTLNASPWFNIAIAVLFVFMAAAMFDLIHVDFSRFQGRVGTGEKKKEGLGRYWIAFSMGTVAALLAGACVAPVVISVLVWAGDLYARGIAMGLVLPFVLGVGMALPWPFAGAGLSLLPKPGPWMNWVKRGFGVLILGLAVYYGHLGYELFQVTPVAEGAAEKTEQAAVNANEMLVEGLAEALKEGKPVFIDFWATWCKNCLAMEKTTFKEPEVESALMDYVFIKYQAEQPKDEEIAPVLKHFGVIGLPTYVVLAPEE